MTTSADLRALRARIEVSVDQDVLFFPHPSGQCSWIILEPADDFTDFGHVRQWIADLDALIAKTAREEDA